MSPNIAMPHVTQMTTITMSSGHSICAYSLLVEIPIKRVTTIEAAAIRYKPKWNFVNADKNPDSLIDTFKTL